MVMTAIDYYKFDSDDIVGHCPIDAGPLVRDATLWDLLPEVASLREDLELGNLVVAFCPAQGHVAILREGVVITILGR
jgi:hypothetical protein